jgi:antagonist of KipI
MTLHVLDPGLASRVVDLGRPSSRSLGVAVGGAADRAALVLGNALVGNPANAPALEVCLKGPVLRAEAQLGCVLFGAPFSLASARQPLKVASTFTLQPGEEVHIGGTKEGMRGYLCVRGGFSVPEVLRSRSSLENVKAGDNLVCSPSILPQRFFPPAVAAVLQKDRCWLRSAAGPQADWFKDARFFDQEFRVTPALDRMGVRLEGKPLGVPERELVSEPVCPGAVQVTRDGQCIVLGVDGQTIGGYPKIAQVIQADLDKLGQLRPGDAITFGEVSLSRAVELYSARQAFLHEWTIRALVSLDGW